jgi:hypothetical protein
MTALSAYLLSGLCCWTSTGHAEIKTIIFTPRPTSIPAGTGLAAGLNRGFGLCHTYTGIGPGVRDCYLFFTGIKQFTDSYRPYH